MSLIRPSRRDILRVMAAAPAFALPALARAGLGPPVDGNPTHFSFTLGAAKLTVISDGWFAQPMSWHAANAPEAERAAFIAAHYLDPETNYAHTNHLYIELGDARVLVDAGSGPWFQPTTGRLLANMEAAGIDPQAVTHVVMTHAHPDHIWGVRDDFDEAVIPDAEYLLGEAEHAFWNQDGLVDRSEGRQQQFAVGALNAFATSGIDWTLAAPGHLVAPGITMIPTPGHTAGHMSVRVDTAAGSLIALGDCLIQPALNVTHPQWVGEMDDLPDETVATRLSILDMAATDRIAVIGYHFPFPGVGHIATNGDGYDFIPALWEF